jgi:magnesium transporter
MTRRVGKSHAKRRTPPGAAPGTLIADPTAVQTSIDMIGYGKDQIFERQGVSIDDIRTVKGTVPVLWINASGLADIECIRTLGDLFGLHSLALEDVINVHQRPKAEEYENHVFVVTRMILASRHVETEQVSLFVGDGFILTFQERSGDCFEPVRERLRRHKGRIRDFGTDYLAYALIDAVIDAYFPVLERYGERLEELEDAVISHPSPELIAKVHSMKRDLLSLRRAIWPHREMINMLIRDETTLVTDQTRLYIRDCYDHTIQLMDIVETYREIASGLVDIYLSSMSTHLNDIMKVLTIIATIFMPLGFIASLYGMNFDRTTSPWNMPELGWQYGYPFALGVMAIAAAGLVYYFWKQRWIGHAPNKHAHGNQKSSPDPFRDNK